jgi:hypothetical protein
MSCAAANAAVTVLDVQYKPDQAFPEHECFWNHSQLPGPCGPSSPLGSSIHVFLHNAGSSSVTVQDVVLAGISLELALYEEEQVVKRHPVSIYFALAHGAITQQQFDTLLDAGEPVWYKAAPTTIPAGTTGQVVVRLRQVPVTPSVSIGVVHTGGSTNITAPVESDQPQVAGVSFSSDLMKVYLYWRRGDGTAPTSILMDGNDVTTNTTTVGDPSVDIVASVLQLAQPLSVMSFHIFQGLYADSRIASAGVRTWANPFIYGTWGAQPGDSGDYAAARAWIDDATNHCVNALVVQGGSNAVKSYLQTSEGRQYAADHGYGFVIDEIGKWSCQNPMMWFIRDEPDAADSRVTGLPGDKMVGSLADMAVERGEELRAAYPEAPTTLNIDSTYKPFNWYNYGQVPDVLMTDPYYQNRLRAALWYYPEQIPLYSKATYIYAVSQLAQSAAEPNPLHVVLYSCEYVDTAGGQTFPFAPPACKRIEVYYALAAGAKGMSYWWYKPGSPSNGLGAGTPEALALWREIGLLGAEIRTALPLLVTSCPAAVTLQPSAGLWIRSLLVGSDTFVLLAVNDDYYNDEYGCHYTTIANAGVAVTLPTWLQSPTAFEIAAGGIHNVATQVAGNQLQVNLGTVDLTRMIVVTSNALLRNIVEQRYDQEVRAKVCSFAPEVCTSSGPTIILQPAAQSVCPGATATFTVSATGSGTLSYQWQKNGSNLTDDGHYSGCTTATLTVTNADINDAANYRCAVSDSNGTTNSNQAVLTLKPATTITQHPSNQAVPWGQTATFTVAAEGDSPLSYQWQKNGSNLTNDGHYSGCTTATLTITNVDSNDAANYRCAVTGGCSSVTSDAASLTVTQPGDFDHDGDVDEEDFGHLQACLTGPAIPITDQNCLDTNLDGDIDVDQDDCAIFLGCMTGANLLGDPNCAY